MDPAGTDSLVFPVWLKLPAEISAQGRRWFRRPEFHVTTFTPDDLSTAYALDGDRLREAGDEHRDELTRRRPIHFDGRVARVHADDGRRTLVAFCDVAGLDRVYERLSQAVGAPLELPPTHVTLYTAEPGMKGIGLTTEEQLRERAALLPPGDAAAVLRHLPADA